MQLARRETLIGLDEAHALGMETLVLVYQARECLRGQVSDKPPFLSPIRKEFKQKDVSDIIASTFNLRLEDIPGIWILL